MQPHDVIRSSAALAGAVLALLAATPASAQSATEILAAHLEATGGRAALDRVERLDRSGHLVVESELVGRLEGPIQVLIVPGQRVYRSTEIGPFSTTVGWDGSIGWERTAQGVRALEGAELDQLRAESQPFYLADLDPDAAARVVRLDDDDLDGTAHYVLQIDESDIGELRFYIDQETHLVAQVIQSTTLPMIGEALVVTDLWEYEAHDGVLMPRAVSVTIEGLFASETTFDETTVNGAIDATVFDQPR